MYLNSFSLLFGLFSAICLLCEPLLFQLFHSLILSFFSNLFFSLQPPFFLHQLVGPPYFSFFDPPPFFSGNLPLFLLFLIISKLVRRELKPTSALILQLKSCLFLNDILGITHLLFECLLDSAERRSLVLFLHVILGLLEVLRLVLPIATVQNVLELAIHMLQSVFLNVFYFRVLLVLKLDQRLLQLLAYVNGPSCEIGVLNVQAIALFSRVRKL